MKFYKKEILSKLRNLCDKYNVLLILDEIFTGFGRTAKNFAYEHASIKPDFITLVKGLTGGGNAISRYTCIRKNLRRILF